MIAPLLVIQRVANKSALTSNTIVSGRLSPFEARSRGELTDGSDALPGGDPTSSVDRMEWALASLGVRLRLRPIPTGIHKVWRPPKYDCITFHSYTLFPALIVPFPPPSDHHSLFRRLSVLFIFHTIACPWCLYIDVCIA